MSDSALLLDQPDWHQATSELVAGLAALDAEDERIELLESVCHALGDRLYPAFLHILHTLVRFADSNALQLVAATLIDCLMSGRLPSGKLPAWGASSFSGDTAFGQSRTLGPIEYVCVWYAQPAGRPPLSQERFYSITTSLLTLVASDDRARRLYATKLLADADDPLSGSLASQTRNALRALAQQWEHSSDSQRAADAFVDALQSNSLLAHIGQRPMGSAG